MRAAKSPLIQLNDIFTSGIPEISWTLFSVKEARTDKEASPDNNSPHGFKTVKIVLHYYEKVMALITVPCPPEYITFSERICQKKDISASEWSSRQPAGISLLRSSACISNPVRRSTALLARI
ncbi:TPA: hypothetical protein ACIVNJ_004396 [Salmonella enterica subsp. diarizonae serovar 61:r:-]